MRRAAPLLPAAAVLLVLLACGKSSDKGARASTSATSGVPTSSTSALFARLPAGLQASRELKVGSDIEYAPIEFYKEGTEQAQGVDYDLAQAMGQKLGVKVTFVNDTDFAGIIGAL